MRGGKGSKKLSPPRILPLTSLRISEGKRSSPTGPLAPCWAVSQAPNKAFWPKTKTIGGGPFTPHNLSEVRLPAVERHCIARFIFLFSNLFVAQFLWIECN
jgi:hypothetical protein